MNIRMKFKSRNGCNNLLNIIILSFQEYKWIQLVFDLNSFYWMSLETCSSCKADTTPPPNCPNMYYKHAHTCFLACEPCNEQRAQRGKKQVRNGHCAPLLSFSGTEGLVDVFLWSLGAQRHFTCVNLIRVPVCRLDVQIAADLESVVCLLNSRAGRDPTAHWTPSSQPADICKRHRLTGQTDQSGLVGLELSSGRREDCQDRRREAGAWKHTKDSQQRTRR